MLCNSDADRVSVVANFDLLGGDKSMDVVDCGTCGNSSHVFDLLIVIRRKLRCQSV
jgi:hypothetical protein